MYGQKDDQYSIAIGSGGVLNFPEEIGPINIFEKGNSFESLQNLIKERVNQKFGGGVQVFVGISGLRQIRVFLAGEFKEPGQILVYAGSSLSNLLMDCGGVTEIASLRNLTLKEEARMIKFLTCTTFFCGESFLTQFWKKVIWFFYRP